MSYIGLALLTAFCIVVMAYYVVLCKRPGWARTSFQEKTEQVLSPLPILVGLVGAIAGYQATKQATAVMERGMETDNIAEVRRTAKLR